jgi:hypothetical protein
MLASFIAGIVAPSFAVMSEIHPGAWMGGWGEKNALGGHAARASFLFAFLAWRDSDHRRAWMIGLIVALALVLLSRSATSLLGALLGLGVIGAAWWMLKGRRHALALVWAGVAGLGLLVLIYATAPGILLGLIGKDETLTGRTDIWIELAAAIEQKPALGYGYLAFWGDRAALRLARRSIGSAPGHNGWSISRFVASSASLFVIEVAATTWRNARLALRRPQACSLYSRFMLRNVRASSRFKVFCGRRSLSWQSSRGARAVQAPQRAAPSVGPASFAPASALAEPVSISYRRHRLTVTGHVMREEEQ